jgi:DNA polymerase I
MQQQIETALRMVGEAKVMAYDTETNGLDWKRTHVCGYSFSDGQVKVYIPVRHQGGGNIAQVADFEKALAGKFKDRPASHVTVGHNIKFDIHASANHGVILNDNIADTMVQQALLDEHTWSFALGNVAKLYGVTPKVEKKLYNHLSSMFGCAPDKKSMAHFHRLAGNDPIAVEYAAGDTQTTFELHAAQIPQIEAQELRTVVDLEHRLTWPLFAMERRGLEVATEQIANVIREIDKEQNAIRERYPDVALVNPRSSIQLKEYFSLANITDWPLTDKGNPSFTADWLIKSEEGQAILAEKRLHHFYDTFLEPLMTRHLFNGCVYTNFNQVKSDEYGTVSGRLSSNDPNLQQVPKRDKYIGRLFRRLFRARKGFFLAEPDYSQAEPRLYAHYSQEPRLIQGYNASPFIDMHSIVQQMIGVERNKAKTINLGILYMMGLAKLAKSLGISEDQALEILKSWYSLFPRVKDFRKSSTSIAEQRGYVRTLLKRRRRFPDPKAAYKSANAVIQGGSADILKYKMVEVFDYIKSLPADTIHLLINIHDALLFEVQDSDIGRKALDECNAILEDVNGDPFKLTVPFVVDVHTGYTWEEATYGLAA